MKTCSAGTFLGEDVQAAQWRRAQAIQWCESEGLVAANVVSCSVLEDGRVVVTRYAVNAEGHKFFNEDRSAPAREPELVITPKTPPPWLEWE